jgi:hypothetical protein
MQGTTNTSSSFGAIARTTHPPVTGTISAAAPKGFPRWKNPQLAETKNDGPARSHWWFYCEATDCLVLHLNLSNNATCDDWCATSETKPVPNALLQHQGVATNTGFSDWFLTCNPHGKHEKDHALVDQSLPTPTNTFSNLAFANQKLPLKTTLPTISDHDPFGTPFTAQKPFNPYARSTTTTKSSSSISSLESPIYVSRAGDEFAPYVEHTSVPTPHTNDKKPAAATTPNTEITTPGDDDVSSREMIHLTLEDLEALVEARIAEASAEKLATTNAQQPLEPSPPTLPAKTYSYIKQTPAAFTNKPFSNS